MLPTAALEFTDDTLLFAAIGVMTLAAALLPRLLGKLPISIPMVFLAAGIITVGGGLQILSLPFGDLIVFSSWLSITITMFAIVIVMNAVNFIDGLDGLVAGVAIIANGVFFVYSFVISITIGQTEYFNLAVAVEGGPASTGPS